MSLTPKREGVVVRRASPRGQTSPNSKGRAYNRSVTPAHRRTSAVSETTTTRALRCASGPTVTGAALRALGGCTTLNERLSRDGLVDCHSAESIGDCVWIANRDGSMSRMQSETGREILRTAQRSIVCRCLVAVESEMWGGFNDGCVRIINVEDGEIIHEMLHHSSTIDALVHEHHSLWVFSGSSDFSICQWHAQTRTLTKKFLHGSTGVTSLAPSGDVLFSGGADGTIRLWDVISAQSQLLSGHKDAVSHLQIVEFLLWSASWDGALKVWKVRTGECVATLPPPEGRPISLLMRVGSTVWVGVMDAIHIYDALTHTLLQKLNDHASHIAAGAILSMRTVAQIWCVATDGRLLTYHAECAVRGDEEAYNGELRRRRDEVVRLRVAVAQLREDADTVRTEWEQRCSSLQHELAEMTERNASQALRIDALETRLEAAEERIHEQEEIMARQTSAKILSTESNDTEKQRRDSLIRLLESRLAEATTELRRKREEELVSSHADRPPTMDSPARVSVIESFEEKLAALQARLLTEEQRNAALTLEISTLNASRQNRGGKPSPPASRRSSRTSSPDIPRPRSSADTVGEGTELGAGVRTGPLEASGGVANVAGSVTFDEIHRRLRRVLREAANAGSLPRPLRLALLAEAARVTNAAALDELPWGEALGTVELSRGITQTDVIPPPAVWGEGPSACSATQQRALMMGILEEYCSNWHELTRRQRDHWVETSVLCPPLSIIIRECSTWINNFAETGTNLRRRIIDVLRIAELDAREVASKTYSTVVKRASDSASTLDGKVLRDIKGGWRSLRWEQRRALIDMYLAPLIAGADEMRLQHRHMAIERMIRLPSFHDLQSIVRQDVEQRCIPETGAQLLRGFNVSQTKTMRQLLQLGTRPDGGLVAKSLTSGHLRMLRPQHISLLCIDYVAQAVGTFDEMTLRQCLARLNDVATPPPTNNASLVAPPSLWSIFERCSSKWPHGCDAAVVESVATALELETFQVGRLLQRPWPLVPVEVQQHVLQFAFMRGLSGGSDVSDTATFEAEAEFPSFAQVAPYLSAMWHRGVDDWPRHLQLYFWSSFLAPDAEIMERRCAVASDYEGHIRGMAETLRGTPFCALPPAQQDAIFYGLLTTFVPRWNSMTSLQQCQWVQRHCLHREGPQMILEQLVRLSYCPFLEKVLRGTRGVTRGETALSIPASVSPEPQRGQPSQSTSDHTKVIASTRPPTLAEIAVQCGVPTAQLQRLNPSLPTDDVPLELGSQILLPPRKASESAAEIAGRHSISLNDFMAANPRVQEPTQVISGSQRIIIPVVASHTASDSTTPPPQTPVMTANDDAPQPTTSSHDTAVHSAPQPLRPPMLAEIAVQCGVPSSQLLRLNPTLKRDDEPLAVGSQVLLPPRKASETAASFAKRFSVEIAELITHNPRIKDPSHNITPSQRIVLPIAAGVAQPLPQTTVTPQELQQTLHQQNAPLGQYEPQQHGGHQSQQPGGQHSQQSSGQQFVAPPQQYGAQSHQQGGQQSQQSSGQQFVAPSQQCRAQQQPAGQQSQQSSGQQFVAPPQQYGVQSQQPGGQQSQQSSGQQFVAPSQQCRAQQQPAGQQSKHVAPPQQYGAQQQQGGQQSQQSSGQQFVAPAQQYGAQQPSGGEQSQEPGGYHFVTQSAVQKFVGPSQERASQQPDARIAAATGAVIARPIAAQSSGQTDVEHLQPTAGFAVPRSDKPISLSDVAHSAGVSLPQLMRANPSIRDPKAPLGGATSVVLPARSSAEPASKIAERLGVPLSALVSANPALRGVGRLVPSSMSLRIPLKTQQAKAAPLAPAPPSPAQESSSSEEESTEDASDADELVAFHADQPLSTAELSDKFNVDADELKKLNRALRSADKCEPGTVVLFKRRGTTEEDVRKAPVVRAKHGLTLKELCNRYDVPIADVLKLNPQHSARTPLLEGTPVVIPIEQRQTSDGGHLTDLVHVSQLGESLHSIGHFYGVPPEALARMMPSAQNIRDTLPVGTSVLVPRIRHDRWVHPIDTDVSTAASEYGVDPQRLTLLVSGGQKYIRLPPLEPSINFNYVGAVYVCGGFDTLETICFRFGVEEAIVRQFNPFVREASTPLAYGRRVVIVAAPSAAIVGQRRSMVTFAMEGDTIERIATRAGTSVDRILQDNPAFTPEETLQRGEEVRLSAFTEPYRYFLPCAVLAGDGRTLAAMAYHCGVPLDAAMHCNPQRPAHWPATPPAMVVVMPSHLGHDGTSQGHWEATETVDAFARRYGTTRDAIADVNGDDPTKPICTIPTSYAHVALCVANLGDTETLPSIAEQFGFTTEAVQALNAHRPAHARWLVAPRSSVQPEHAWATVAEAGDSLHQVALRFGVDVKELQRANALHRADRDEELVKGQSIILPQAVKPHPKLAPSDNVAIVTRRQAHPGESLEDISRRLGVPAEKMKHFNQQYRVKRTSKKVLVPHEEKPLPITDREIAVVEPPSAPKVSDRLQLAVLEYSEERCAVLTLELQRIHSDNEDLKLKCSALSAELESLAFIINTRPRLLQALVVIYKQLQPCGVQLETLGSQSSSVILRNGLTGYIDKIRKSSEVIGDVRRRYRYALASLFTEAELLHSGVSPSLLMASES